MKSILYFVVFVWVHFFSSAQSDFTLNSLLNKMVVQVNGKEYIVDSIGIKIKTNFPKFDTLTFLGEAPNTNQAIICNFKPDSTYSITHACCGSLDIIPSSKLKNDSLLIWDYEADFYKIQKQLMDNPFISVRTINNPMDSIYMWHADAACETKCKLIDTSLWSLGIPPKCFYWNNITTLLFFKTDQSLSEHESTDLEQFLSIENIVILTDISLRLLTMSDL
jgi:hypothetical protein